MYSNSIVNGARITSAFLGDVLVQEIEFLTLESRSTVCFTRRSASKTKIRVIELDDSDGVIYLDTRKSSDKIYPEPFSESELELIKKTLKFKEFKDLSENREPLVVEAVSQYRVSERTDVIRHLVNEVTSTVASSRTLHFSTRGVISPQALVAWANSDIANNVKSTIPSRGTVERKDPSDLIARVTTDNGVLTEFNVLINLI